MSRLVTADLANTRTPSALGVGDLILCRDEYVPVLEIQTRAPGQHAGTAIHHAWHLVEVLTRNGSRFYGSQSAPFIGSDLRMHWGPTADDSTDAGADACADCGAPQHGDCAPLCGPCHAEASRAEHDDRTRRAARGE